jgi:hypothetical protein
MQYLACSGALVPDVTSKQVPKMNKAQLITVSAGGNDANLAEILNYCIYQWSTWWGFTCDGRLRVAKDKVNKDDYTNDLQALLDAMTAKLADQNSRIYWVGYEHFWDSSTNECDQVTWSFHRNFGYREYLLQSRR